jgi:hypothetical protein
MVGRQKCVGCGRLSPETNGEVTLTTSFGWRIRRATGPATGDGPVEWRCPPCWQKFKTSQMATTGESPVSVPPSSVGGGKREG